MKFTIILCLASIYLVGCSSSGDPLVTTGDSSPGSIIEQEAGPPTESSSNFPIEQSSSSPSESPSELVQDQGLETCVVGYSNLYGRYCPDAVSSSNVDIVRECKKIKLKGAKTGITFDVQLKDGDCTLEIKCKSQGIDVDTAITLCHQL